VVRQFEAKSLCILGRQPSLGLAELESLYGSGRIRPLAGAAILDVPAQEIDFQRLGGTIKVARLLTPINSSRWADLSHHLIDKIPEHTQYLPEGKFTLGLSVYGLNVNVPQIEATLLELKKLVRQTGRSVRIVPNKAPALNSAQVLHNKLTHKGAWELLFVKDGSRTWLAQTLFVQDIEAYAARDQARPARDARVGMLPPKLAQIIVNLATGTPMPKDNKNWNRGDGLVSFVILDPFCGTGVMLQEALLAGYSVYGTDIDPRMVEYTKQNIKWLVERQPKIEGRAVVEVADATKYQWPGFSTIASEVFLGRPLNSLPSPDKLKTIINDANTVIKKFLENLAPQLKPHRTICLAIPAWRKPSGDLIKLPLIDHLTDMGYTYSDFEHIRREELVYFRENQVVARQLLRLRKNR
jgi:tRNA G10  N-methylase Trm11